MKHDIDAKSCYTRPRKPDRKHTTTEATMKRNSLKTIASQPYPTACADTCPPSKEKLVRRFDGRSFQLAVDVVPGFELQGVVMYNDSGSTIHASSLVAKHTREILSLGNPRIPQTVQAKWRVDAGWGAVRKACNEGAIADAKPRFPHNTILHTASGNHPLALRIANDFPSRLRGLMLAPPLAHDEGLLLTGCGSIHTAFMRQTIDVIYLDRSDRVVRCVPMLRPWRSSAAWGAVHVLELATGSIARCGITPGDRLQR